MTDQQRDALGAWAIDAPSSERTMALRAVEDAAKRTGRAGDQAEAMDRAYRAVAASAGIGNPASYWADDWGPRDRHAWESAASIAAVVAAVLVVEDEVDPKMRTFLLEPWDQVMA